MTVQIVLKRHDGQIIPIAITQCDDNRNVTIELDGQAIAKAVVANIPAILRTRGQKA